MLSPTTISKKEPLRPSRRPKKTTDAKDLDKAKGKAASVHELKMRGKLRSQDCHSNQDAGTRKKDRSRKRKRAPRVDADSRQRGLASQSSSSRRLREANFNDGSRGS
jgi:hypothetical protein